MRLLILSWLVLLSGCTAMLLGSGSSAPSGERSAARYAADADTTAAVRQRLGADAVLARHGIGVSTYKGRVTLTGTVESYTVRNRAGELASGVAGVTSVDNRIEVHAD